MRAGRRPALTAARRRRRPWRGRACARPGTPPRCCPAAGRSRTAACRLSCHRPSAPALQGPPQRAGYRPRCADRCPAAPGGHAGDGLPPKAVALAAVLNAGRAASRKAVRTPVPASAESLEAARSRRAGRGAENRRRPGWCPRRRACPRCRTNRLARRIPAAAHRRQGSTRPRLRR